MKKWFREYYYDEEYQKVTEKYFEKVMLSPDSSRYTGGQAIGNHKKATKEQLKERVSEAETKLKMLKEELALHDEMKKKSEEEASADPDRVGTTEG